MYTILETMLTHYKRWKNVFCGEYLRFNTNTEL